MDTIRTYFNRFIKLSDTEWTDFEKCLSKEVVEQKSFILKEGELCNYLAFIENGMFKFYNMEDGEEKITSFFFSGDFVSNYRSFLTGIPSKHFIESMQESIIYKIYKKDLLVLYDTHQNIERLGRLIAENLYLNVANRLDSFLFDSPKQRYEDLVRRNSKLLEAIPQYMLASYLGVKPETLSRIRSRK
jgi:CRP/FNR family transcriptional regulator, anaerobic regulatory protein